jgi:hypothetical protein
LENGSVGADSGNERRELVRASSSLRFSMERLRHEDDLQDAIGEMASESPEPLFEGLDRESDPIQLRMLELLHRMTVSLDDLCRRIDAMGARMDGKSVEGIERERHTLIDLSGGGFSYLTRVAPNQGEMYRVSIELSSLASMAVFCVTEVKWVHPLEESERNMRPWASDETRRVGMEITHIRESDRERIIGAVFRAQRQSLRARKQAREETKA